MTDQINNVGIYYHGADWAAAMRAECDHAQTSILITALSVLPPGRDASGPWPELYAAWKTAAQRGIKVRVWLPAPSAAHPATRQNHTSAIKMAAAGLFPHLVPGAKLLHAKTCTIDCKSVWIGSGNFTCAAAHHNHEAYLRADCAHIARELAARWEQLP
jgi:phosphatidylserine/phosphatidylglycerophosphate/cardiolipin synthase-like enzyme